MSGEIEIEQLYQDMKEECRSGGAGSDMQIFNYCKPVFIKYLKQARKAGVEAERKKYKTALSALSEYINLLKQDRKLFKLTLTGEDEPKPTKYMAVWMANTIKLRLSEEKLIKIFGIHTKGE